MASDDQLEILDKKYPLPIHTDERRFPFITGAISAADFATFIAVFSVTPAGHYPDGGLTVALCAAVISFGMIYLAVLMGWFKSLLYLVVSTVIVIIAAFCTAVALELLFYHLIPIVFWLFLPWPLLSVLVVGVPLYRFAARIMRENKDMFEQASRTLQEMLRSRWRKSLPQWGRRAI